MFWRLSAGVGHGDGDMLQRPLCALNMFEFAGGCEWKTPRASWWMRGAVELPTRPGVRACLRIVGVLGAPIERGVNVSVPQGRQPLESRELAHAPG